MSKKMVLRVGAGAIAVILIGMVLFVANAFFGNPVSKTFARVKAKKYINENYKQLHLNIDDIGYDFKNGNYMVYVQSKKSEDTHFYLFYRSGNIVSSTYDSDVLSGQNTYDRLAKDYTAHLTPLLEKALGEEFRSVSFVYPKELLSAANKLALDIAFDRSLIKDGALYLHCNYIQNDSQYFAKTLAKAYEVLSAEGYAFQTFSLRGEHQGILTEISGVTAEHIQSGNLGQLIEQAKSADNSQGIHVFIKGDK